MTKPSMKFFYVHPDDARWLRRWLCHNLLAALVIAGFLVALRFETSVPLETMSPVRADQSEFSHGPASPSLQRALVNATVPGSVAPQGWRRTQQGWEHVSTWPRPPRPLGEIIRTQTESEPAWVRATLKQLRDIPPLVFALIQIAAIAAIIHASRSRQGSSPLPSGSP